MEIKVPFTSQAYFEKKLASHSLEETEGFSIYEKAMHVNRENVFLNVAVTMGNENASS